MHVSGTLTLRNMKRLRGFYKLQGKTLASAQDMYTYASKRDHKTCAVYIPARKKPFKGVESTT